MTGVPSGFVFGQVVQGQVVKCPSGSFGMKRVVVLRARPLFLGRVLNFREFGRSDDRVALLEDLAALALVVERAAVRLRVAVRRAVVVPAPAEKSNARVEYAP